MEESLIPPNFTTPTYAKLKDTQGEYYNIRLVNPDSFAEYLCEYHVLNHHESFDVIFGGDITVILHVGKQAVVVKIAHSYEALNAFMRDGKWFATGSVGRVNAYVFTHYQEKLEERDVRILHRIWPFLGELKSIRVYPKFVEFRAPQTERLSTLSKWAVQAYGLEASLQPHVAQKLGLSPDDNKKESGNDSNP